MSHVLVGTPCYDGKVSDVYLHAIHEYMGLDHKITLAINSGDSLVTRARNKIISEFYRNKKIHGFTHLLWQDADIYMPSSGLQTLLDRNVDVIAAPVPVKEPRISEQGHIMTVMRVYEEVGPMLYKAENAGTGLILMKDHVVDDLIRFCMNTGNVYNGFGQTWYDVFRVGSNDKKFYFSEDWYLSRTLRQLGYEIYVDSSFTVVHSESPRARWTRAAMPMSERILSGNAKKPLPENLRSTRWAPMGYNLELSYTNSMEGL